MSIAECPRCGYHIATELKKGVPALEAEVRRLEDLIPRLQEEKAILLRRINNAQEKTRHLPFEVLSNIFQFARPPIDFTAYEPIHYYIDDPDFPLLTSYVDPAENFHHTLAAVSHHWRQVALSTPQLWTSISLRILNTFTDFNTSLLDLHLKNAHNLPISIRLDLTNPAIAWTAHEGSKRDAFLTHLDPLEATIFNQNADKIKSLVFIEPPIEWFFFDRSNLSRCTSVTIYWPSARDDSVFNFEDLPCLQHVKLVDSDTLFELPTTITDLQLAGTDITHSMEAIAELPNLVKFETTGTTTRFIKPAVLHRLKHLTWKTMRVDHNHGFLRSIRFVRLTTLEWDEIKFVHHHGPLSEEGRRLRFAFFSSLPSTLSSLTIGDIEIDSPNLVDLLGSIPQLAELHFIRSPRPVVIGAVKAIGRPPANRGASSSSSTILSNLSVLSVSDIRSGVDAFVFVGMLEALHATGPRPKRFHLTTHSDVEWHADVLHEVQHLLSSGLDARVTLIHIVSTLNKLLQVYLCLSYISELFDESSLTTIPFYLRSNHPSDFGRETFDLAFFVLKNAWADEQSLSFDFVDTSIEPLLNGFQMFKDQGIEDVTTRQRRCSSQAS